MIFLQSFKDAVSQEWNLDSWKMLDQALFRDMFGRTRIAKGFASYDQSEPLLHNPYGPAIKCEGEESFYYLHGCKVDERRIAAAEPTETREIELNGYNGEKIRVRYSATFMHLIEDFWQINLWLPQTDPKNSTAAQIPTTVNLYFKDTAQQSWWRGYRNSPDESNVDFFRTIQFGQSMIRGLQDQLWNTDLSRASSEVEKKIKDAIDNLLCPSEPIQTVEEAPVESGGDLLRGIGGAATIAAASAILVNLGMEYAKSIVGVPAEVKHAP